MGSSAVLQENSTMAFASDWILSGGGGGGGGGEGGALW